MLATDLIVIPPLRPLLLSRVSAMRMPCVTSGWAARAVPAGEGPWQEPGGRVGSISSHTGSQGITQTCLAQLRARTTKEGRNWGSYWGGDNPSSSVGASRMAH